LSVGDDLNFIRACVDYWTTHLDLAPPQENPMNTRSPRYATVALLSAAFALMAAGSSSAQNRVSSNASNSAVRSAVTDSRDAAFRARDSALHRNLARAHRHAAARDAR
jgi:hypothetical protein